MNTLSNKIKGRIAGGIYLVVVLTGIFSLGYAPNQLIVWDDPAKTFQNINNAEFLFRLSIFSSLICYTAFTFLPLSLYPLFKYTHKTYATLMVVLVLVSIPISILNLQHEFTVLSLIKPQPYLEAFHINQIQSQVTGHLKQYNDGIHLVSLFWGLWLLPLGYLIIRSGLLPAILGYLLILGCLGYLINFIGNTLDSDYSQNSIAKILRLSGSIGEIGTCLWLLILGAKDIKNENAFSNL